MGFDNKEQYTTVVRCIGTGTDGPIYASLLIPTHVAELIEAMKCVLKQKAKNDYH